MQQRDRPPWDTRPDLVAVPVTVRRAEVVIRGYDDRGGDRARDAAASRGRRHLARSPSTAPNAGSGHPHRVLYLALTCLAVLVLPGVMAGFLWLRAGWSLSPDALIPPSSGSSGAGSSVPPSAGRGGGPASATSPAGTVPAR